MSEFNIITELPIRKLDADTIDQLHDRFEDYHPALAVSPLGWVEVTTTVTAETLRQAISTALAVAGDVVSIHAMTTAEFDRRPVTAFERVPELLSVTEYASRAGTSRQAVLQRLEAGTLAGRKVGNGWVLPAPDVTPADV